MSRMHIRMGRSVECDQAFDAWTSGDLGLMRIAIHCETNPVDRHHLLQSMVESLRKVHRAGGDVQRELLDVAELHLAELPALLEGLRLDGELGRAARGSPPIEFVPPRITTPTVLTKLYKKLGRLDDAKRVQDLADDLGF